MGVGEVDQLPLQSSEAPAFPMKTTALVVIKISDTCSDTSDGGVVACSSDDGESGFFVEMIVLLFTSVDDGDCNISAVTTGACSIAEKRKNTDDKSEEMFVTDDVLVSVWTASCDCCWNTGAAKLPSDCILGSAHVFGAPQKVTDACR